MLRFVRHKIIIHWPALKSTRPCCVLQLPQSARLPDTMVTSRSFSSGARPTLPQVVDYCTLADLLDKKEATLVDVRNKEELINDGQFQDAVSIPLPELKVRTDRDECYAKRINSVNDEVMIRLLIFNIVLSLKHYYGSNTHHKTQSTRIKFAGVFKIVTKI